MSKQCVLRTEGYTVILNLQGLDAKIQVMNMTVDFVLDQRLGNVALRSIPSVIPVNDLRGIISYLEQHITDLQQDLDTRSPVFLPLGVGFRVQALDGERISESGGEFSLSFMINVGSSNDGCANAYVGGQSVVSVANIRHFTSGIRAALTDSD